MNLTGETNRQRPDRVPKICLVAKASSSEDRIVVSYLTTSSTVVELSRPPEAPRTPTW
jgi:hypothetical protein